MTARHDAEVSPPIRHRRDIGRAGCFRFFECTLGDRGSGVAQTVADRTVAALAARRLARETEIAPYFRGRTVAQFSSWSAADGLAVWDDNGLRPAVQIPGALRGGASGLLSILIRASEAALDLHGVGLAHGALYPLGLWTDAEFGAFRFADCSLAFAVKPQIQTPPPWGLIADLDFARLSPEQTGAVSSPPDERTDCYGLGLVFRSLLGGAGDTDYRAPEALTRLFDAMTALEPSARPHSIAAVVETLQQLRRSLSGRMRIPDARRGAPVADMGLRIKIRSAGRDDRVDELRQIWIEARSKSVAIIGPPGIGKTELSRLFADDIALSGVVVASGKADPVRRAQPLLVVRQIVKGLWAQVLLRGAEEAARIGAVVQAALGDDAEFFVAAVPEARPMLGFTQESTRIVSAREQQRLALAVSRFLCSAAQASGGLCLIFDDLQWLDENSLRAVERLVSDVATVPAMLILIVRATPGAPPPPVISGLRKIDLGPMPVAGIAAILRRTFDRRMASAEDLAAQLHTLSGGNPLHVTQILHLMASRGGISWDAGAGMWRWSGGAGSNHVMSDNVLALIAERIAALDLELREAVRAAAGLAEAFDASEIAAVLDRTSAWVEDSLTALAASGLILPAESDGSTRQWRFTHDHVRLAAIRDAPQSERADLRHRIGLKLLSQRDEASLHRHDFIITDCLADYPVKTLDTAGRRRLGEREILVSVDARSRLDFTEAARHLDRAANLLPDDPWRTARSRCVRITEEKIYCAFACGDSETTDRLFSDALDHSPGLLDAAHFYRLQVIIETQAENYSGALRAAARGLSKFGVRMPLSRSSAVAAAALEFARVSFRLGHDPVGRLKALPLSSDPTTRAAIDLIASVLVAAYQVAPELMLAGGLKILGLSLSSGRARSTPIGEALYGLGVSAFLGARRAGFRFGELAAQNAATGNDPYIENQVLLIHAAFVRFWAGKLIDDEPLLRRGYELARQCGDMLFANFHILGLMSHGLARGAPLGELEDLIRWGEDLIRRSREGYSIDTIEKWRDVVVALRGPAALRAEVPAALRPGAGSQRGNQISECYRRVMLCQFLYFAGDFAGSAAAGQAAEKILWRSPGHLVEIEHAFYYGLALAATARQSGGLTWHIDLALRRIVRRLGRWSAGGSDTFSARLALLRAERASLQGSASSVALYEEAIRAAHVSGMPHIAALANEAAARHFLRLGSQAAAQGYAVKARELYEGWGALAKVRALESEIPELLPLPGETEAIGSARGAADFAGGALLSASDPNELLPILLTLAGRVSGADFAVYASVENQSVTIDAEAQGMKEPAQAGLSPELLDSASPLVLSYVAATGEGLWGNLAADQRFSSCSRLAGRRPSAVCCLPVQRKDEVFGLLYLEHFSNPAAFSFSVVGALKTLAGNLASTLQNEQTSRALRVRNAELTEAARKIALLEAAKSQFEKFAPNVVREEISANPKAPKLDARPRDVTVLFLDMAGYTNLNERLSPEEARALIESCFSRLVDPIYRHGGEMCDSAGDGLMVLFSAGEPAEHALEAVRSGREMKQELTAMMAEARQGEPHIVINFGLNSGQGAVGLTRLEGREHSRWIYSVRGQVVNIAARIVGQAKNGAILVGPETARRVRDRIDMTSVGFHNLKGLTMEVELFSAG